MYAKDRVAFELDELNWSKQRLHRFISEGKHVALGEKQAGLLERQLDCMEQYSIILSERLAILDCEGSGAVG